MKSRQVPQNNGAGDLDEHDMPTEPIAIDPTAPLPSQGGSGANWSLYTSIPSPQAPEQPFPRQYVQGGLQPGSHDVRGGAYPFVAAPLQPVGKPVIENTAPARSEPKAGKRVRASSQRHSPVPALVGLFFVLVQLLLLVRFGLKVIQWSDINLWIDILYAFTDLVIWPVRALVQKISLPFTLWEELYTLLAILLYGLSSRLLVRLLRAILHRP
jgi:hypothetical protein